MSEQNLQPHVSAVLDALQAIPELRGNAVETVSVLGIVVGLIAKASGKPVDMMLHAHRITLGIVTGELLNE